MQVRHGFDIKGVAQPWLSFLNQSAAVSSSPSASGWLTTQASSKSATIARHNRSTLAKPNQLAFTKCIHLLPSGYIV